MCEKYILSVNTDNGRKNKSKGNMKTNGCLLKECFKEGFSVEEAIMCVESFDDVQRYSLDKCELTKTQKKRVIERLLKFSETYDEIWNVDKCAIVMGYALTYKQIKRMIEKLVWASESRIDLEMVGRYARSKGLFGLYCNVKGEKKVAKLLGLPRN